MKTQWEYSLTTEALRVIHAVYQTFSGFYRINNFPIRFYDRNQPKANEIIIPDLPYNTIPNFWKTIKTLGTIAQDTRNVPDKFRLQVEDLIKAADLPTLEFTATQNTWNRAQNVIINEIYKIIPEKRNYITSLAIYPTLFGSSSTLNYPKKWPAEISLYLRQDQDIYAITEMILTALTRKDVYAMNGLWPESELLVDWLLIHSSLADILKSYQPESSFLPTIKTARHKQSGKVNADSNIVYNKLGINIRQQPISIEKNHVYINNQKALSLTAKEEILLRLFVHSRDHVINYDDISTVIFPDEEHFSLWAIAKTIERLRNKLEYNGLTGSCIQSVRGQGYILKN